MDNDLVGVYGDISEAIRSLKEKSTCDPDPDKREYFRKEVDRLIGLLSSQSPSGGDAVAYLINHARDAIADVLDRKHGASVTDHRIFEALARNFEDEYHKDMQALNVVDWRMCGALFRKIEMHLHFLPNTAALQLAFCAKGIG
ncbi:cysteinyl-tRNA synthetase [Clonorchis sinensis]|uniref:Cysteinyl-tRNA synthetase n=1 Tax=Clonorchis sinensis TaxID=79923 RepID=G7YTF4_CLOSI|nr:cysteinyl-tRNA synthetase [Clonorchis sinensis]